MIFSSRLSPRMCLAAVCLGGILVTSPCGRAAHAQSSAPDTARAALITSQERPGGRPFRSERHVLTHTPSEASAFLNDRTPLATVSARAVVNEQRGYTAFALELRPSATATTDDEVGGRTGMPITFAADDRTWSPRSRNESVRDTAVVVVLRRAQFAALAAASRAEVRMKGWEARLPAALRGQMARIEGICTRRPLGCVPADRR